MGVTLNNSDIFMKYVVNDYVDIMHVDDDDTGSEVGAPPF